MEKGPLKNLEIGQEVELGIIKPITFRKTTNLSKAKATEFFGLDYNSAKTCIKVIYDNQFVLTDIKIMPIFKGNRIWMLTRVRNTNNEFYLNDLLVKERNVCYLLNSISINVDDVEQIDLKEYREFVLYAIQKLSALK